MKGELPEGSPRRGKQMWRQRRTDPGFAGETVRDHLPDEKDRTIALHQLLRSARFAESVAPGAWAVTLCPPRKALFRLNVGQVEAIVVRNGYIRLHCVGSLGDSSFVGQNFEERTRPFASVNAPQCTFSGPLDEFARVVDLLQVPHEKFIVAAVSRKNGLPRGCSYLRTHSPGLIAYAEATVDGMSASGTFHGNEEAVTQDIYWEGGRRRRQVETYERDRAARAACLKCYGSVCAVCGFSAEQVYGGRVQGLIEVHHLHPLAAAGGKHTVDPINDLRPVCPNCHAVIHLADPPYTIDEVKAMLRAACKLSGPS